MRNRDWKFKIISCVHLGKVPLMVLEPLPLQLLHHHVCSNILNCIRSSISFIDFIAFSGPYLNFLLTTSHQNESVATTLLFFKCLFFFEASIRQYPETLAYKKESSQVFRKKGDLERAGEQF